MIIALLHERAPLGMAATAAKAPAKRHAGEDKQILARRHAVYLQARERNPSRWSQHTRNWTPIEAVALNPERDVVVSMAVQSDSNQMVSAA